MNLAFFPPVFSTAFYLLSSSWVPFAVFKNVISAYREHRYDSKFSLTCLVLTCLYLICLSHESPLLCFSEKHTCNPEGAACTRKPQQTSCAPSSHYLPQRRSPAPLRDSRPGNTSSTFSVGLAVPLKQLLAFHPSSFYRHFPRPCHVSGLSGDWKNNNE